MAVNGVVSYVLAAVLGSAGPQRALAQQASDLVAGDTDPFVDKQRVFADLDSMTEGTPVWLQDVVVRQKSGNALRIGDRAHELFVVPQDPSSLDFLTIGAHVDVRGTLRKTSNASQARLIYAMSSPAARRFARDRFYVAVAAVTSRS
jgi:hypothetical protein